MDTNSPVAYLLVAGADTSYLADISKVTPVQNKLSKMSPPLVYSFLAELLYQIRAHL
jgi:hypothetical protein